MAEAKQTVVVVPVILEVAKVEVPVAVRVPIDIRHPVVTVGASSMYGMPSFFTGNSTSHSLYFILSLLLISTPHRLI